MADLTEAYETLRERRLARRGETAPGLAVFLQQGMVAWMEICSAVVPAAALVKRKEADSLPTEVVTVMAQMVWACFMNDQEKVLGSHLARKAYLYIRQSTLRQVFEHQEGRRRQYQLREQARFLGWPEDQIEVIDCDLGLSGASADRKGFQQLVAEVGLGKAGLVMGLEVSRLARNSTDWHRLLEICALTETLILDEDGLYDPQQFNDRLLLGLKGTLSEAELHVIRARLQGGIRNKARRGELRTPLPIGFVYDEAGRVALDPDQQVQETLNLFFRTFRRVGTALGTVKYFKRHNLSFPKRSVWSRQPVTWGELDFSTAWRLLGNPRYAGIYFFGATRQRRSRQSQRSACGQ